MMATLSERVACPYCKAAEGQPCQTPSGRSLVSAHRRRWFAFSTAMRTSRYVVRVREDDARLGVKAGEEYVAQKYHVDPGKVTLLARIPDGYDPACNQYHSDVEWLRWDEASR